jgi:hypothetical protein
MALMMASLYEALRDAGSGDEQARKAAEEVAGYENRFQKMETDLALLKWMVGFQIAISAAILLILFA